MIKNRFRLKLTASFFSTAIVPLMVMATVAVATIYQTGIQNAVEIENQSLMHAKEKINKFISDNTETTKLILKAPEGKTLNNITNLTYDEMMFFMEGFIRENPDIIEITMLDKDGKEVKKLINYQKDTASVPTSQRKLPSFQKAKDEGIYYGPIERTHFGAIMTFSTEILDDKGEFIGVNVIKIKANFLTDYVEQLSIGNSGYFLLTDKDGHFISNGARWNNIFSLFKKSQDAKIIKPKIEKTSVFYEQSDMNNQQVIIGEMAVNENLGWKIIAVWPKNDGLAVIQTVTLEIIIAILISLFLVLILSAFLSRHVVKPLEFLKAKAELIGKGEFKQEIKIDTNDEIEDLGKSFNKMANGLQEIQKLKDEFVYIAAHELRTPVTAIRGYLSMALSNDYGKLTSKLRTTLKKVNGANEQLMRLVNDLLEIARAEAQNTKIEVEKVDLVKTMQTVVESLGAWAQMSNIKLFYEHPQSEIYVMANDNKLIEILNNFGSNAIKYNRQGGTVIFSHQEKKNEVVITVQDTGIGMSEDELSHLFEKFYRAKNQEALETSGTGLGLFIVKQLVEKMGGKVFVKSEAGKGSVFGFTLKKA